VTLLLFVLLLVGMYFLMIRPQQRRARETREMQRSVGPGAEVMTTSGIYGTVTEIDQEDDTVVLEISTEVHVRFARAAIGRVISPGPDAGGAEADAGEVDHPTDSDTPANPVIERKD
jgi:preprotein translocase subunit YajC